MPLLQTFGSDALRAFGFGAGGAASFELIQTQVLASTAASVTFNLSAGQQAIYKHLQIRMAVPSGNGANGTYILMRLNGDTAANYSRHELLGQGSAAQSNAATSQTSTQISASSGTNSSSIADGHVLDLLDAFSTSKNKTIRNFTGSSSVALVSGSWMSTAAISSVGLLAYSQGAASTFAVGSRFSVYGVRG